MLITSRNEDHKYQQAIDAIAARHLERATGGRLTFAGDKIIRASGAKILPITTITTPLEHPSRKGGNASAIGSIAEVKTDRRDPAESAILAPAKTHTATGTRICV